MNDPILELADLVADVLAVLSDSDTRGVVFEGPSAPLPTPLPPENKHTTAWSSLASEARAHSDQPIVTGSVGLHATRADLGDCRRCRLCTGREHLVFGAGSPDADLMIVGHAPSRQEDLRGELFLGPGGEMLDNMLTRVLGLARAQVYVTTVVKCRPEGDRAPEMDELVACHPFLLRQIQAVQPKVILLLGELAFQMMFRTGDPLATNRGAWKEFRGIPVLATFHPEHLLAHADDKRHTFADLKAVNLRYDERGGRRA